MLDLIANLTILSVVTASGIWRDAMVDADRFLRSASVPQSTIAADRSVIP